jgi:hypothetical protein
MRLGRLHAIELITQLLFMADAATGAAPGDVNAPAANADPGMEWPEGDDLPAQGLSSRETLMPATNEFRLPANLQPLWHDIVAEDKRKLLGNGQPNPTFGQKIKRRQLKFDQNTPLVVVGGKHDGQPMTATFSTAPRPRGRGKMDDLVNDPKTPWLSDVNYLLLVGLQNKTKPTTPEQVEATVNAYAGGVIRIKHGLSAQCRPDKVRYIGVVTDGKVTSVPDPTGKKGCGARFYTKDFLLDPDDRSKGYVLQAQCDCGLASPAEKAQGQADVMVLIRGFESVEEILPPLVAAPATTA